MEKIVGTNFLGGFILEDFWEELFGYIGIDLFVKILFFVKILSQWRRKEGKKLRSLEVRRKLIALKKAFHLI